MNSPAIRFYLLLSYTTTHATKWHPTEAEGPFSVLTRGDFASADEALEWVESNGIDRDTYTLRPYASV